MKAQTTNLEPIDIEEGIEELRPQTRRFGTFKSKPVATDTVLTPKVQLLVDILSPIRQKLKAHKGKISTTKTVESSVGEYSLGIFSHGNGECIINIQLTGSKPIQLRIENDFKSWERNHGYLADSVPRPSIPLVLSFSGYSYSLKSVYTEKESSFCQRDFGAELTTVVDAVKNSNITEVVDAAISETALESFDVELFEDWYDALQILNN